MARIRRPAAPETTLYAPVKRYLERLGFTVKGEVCGCDLVALRGEEPPIVVVGELKSAFSLELVLQGVNRTAACDEVWSAVRAAGRRGRLRDPRVHKLSVSWASVCSACCPLDSLKCWSSPDRGVPARIRDAALDLSMSIGPATAIPHPADRQDHQS